MHLQGGHHTHRAHDFHVSPSQHSKSVPANMPSSTKPVTIHAPARSASVIFLVAASFSLSFPSSPSPSTSVPASGSPLDVPPVSAPASSPGSSWPESAPTRCLMKSAGNPYREHSTHASGSLVLSHSSNCIARKPTSRSRVGTLEDVPTSSSAIDSPSCSSFWSNGSGRRQRSCLSMEKTSCRTPQRSSWKPIPRLQGTVVHGEFHMRTIQSASPRSDIARSASHAFAVSININLPPCNKARNGLDRRYMSLRSRMSAVCTARLDGLSISILRGKPRATAFAFTGES